jgi:DNA-binding PadR family transcriptional regulator
MMQLNYDEIRLLRELKNSERRIAGNKLDVGLERLVKEGYATTFYPNVSETLYSITTKGWAALHEAEGND